MGMRQVSTVAEADDILYGCHRRGTGKFPIFKKKKKIRLGKNQRLVLEFLRDWEKDPPEGRLHDGVLLSDICLINVRKPGSAVIKYIFPGSVAAEATMDKLVQRGLVKERKKTNSWMVYYKLSAVGQEALR